MADANDNARLPDSHHKETGPDTNQASSAAGEDPHVAWDRRWHEITARIKAERLDDESEPGASLWDERSDLERQLLDTPSTTLPGALAQVRLARDFADAEGSESLLCLRHAVTALECLTSQEPPLGIMRSILEIQTTHHLQIKALTEAVRELQDIARAGGAARLEG